ncbi:MAG: hypothetical protein HXX13_04345 [Bacteroidetes bacterium]|nr:hypothetical protein [Bacteroidota bacterium]
MKSNTILIMMGLTVNCCVLAQTIKTPDEKYLERWIKDPSGRDIGCMLVPGEAPKDYKAPSAIPPATAILIQNVPAYSWSFGCSPTAAAMAAGHYDNTGFPDIYSGPSNGGNAPMDNTCWGMITINGETRNQCPLSATMQNLDQRTERGHVDDYWIVYKNYGPDPFLINNWPQHIIGDCTADYMGTNQSVIGNADGSTRFFFLADGSPLNDYTGNEPGRRDGCHGLRLFYESRGYEVLENYTQLITGMYGNSLGFSFDNFKEEIDNGRPVLLQLSGHTMLGFGYDVAGNTVYLHDTWDNDIHSMTWGSSYAGMAQWGVTVVRLVSLSSPPQAQFMANSSSLMAGQSVGFIDQSVFNPSSWSWSFPGGSPSFSNQQNPVVSYPETGTFSVALRTSNSNGYDTETKNSYINVIPLTYCQAQGSCEPFISGVELNNLNNKSVSCGPQGYSNYSGIYAYLVKSQLYTLVVKTVQSLSSSIYCMAWIDWNHNFDFDDQGESLSLLPMDAHTFTSTFSPPDEANEGETCLRVVVSNDCSPVACGNLSGLGEIEDYTIDCSSASDYSTMHLKLYLEGLCCESDGRMRFVRGSENGHFQGEIADIIRVSVHEAASPFTELWSIDAVPLFRDGTCNILYPDCLDDYYYIRIMHRNSIEIWSAEQVFFGGYGVDYDFSANASASFGNNVKNINGKYCLYTGDVDQDGLISPDDMQLLESQSSVFTSGYVCTDLNGDGLVDLEDMILIDENAANQVGKISPGMP